MRTRTMLLIAGAVAIVGKIAVTKGHHLGSDRHHCARRGHQHRCGGKMSMLEGPQWQGLTESEAREKLAPLIGDRVTEDERDQLDDAIDYLRGRGYLATVDDDPAGETTSTGSPSKT